jgi:DNA-binding transcriptional LysR family regulator
MIDPWCASPLTSVYRNNCNKSSNYSNEEPMNIKGLQAFTRIMETGTLSAAAKSLNASESALSRQLALLEAELGLALFSREKRRLIATEEGETFFREAQRLLDSIEQIPQIVQDIKRGSRKRMRIVVMPRLAASIAAPAVTRFLERWPDMELSVEVQPRRFLERWLASQQFDLGLGSLPAYHASVTTERICSIPAVAVLHPRHPLAGRQSVTLKELQDERFILMPSNTLIGSQVERLLNEAGVKPARSIEVSTTLVCCNFAAEGLGVTITDGMLPKILGSAVKTVRIEPTASLDFGLLYPRNFSHTRETRDLVDLMKAQADHFVKHQLFD